MVTNYQQLNLKNKLGKQPEREQNHRNGDHMEGDQRGEGDWGEVQGLRGITGRCEIDRGS